MQQTISQALKAFLNEDRLVTTSAEQRRYYLSLLVGLLGLVGLVGSLLAYLQDPLTTRTLPVLITASVMALTAAALIRSRYAIVGEWLAVATVFIGTAGVVFLGSYPAQLLVAIFPIFLVSLYLRMIWTIAVSGIAVVIALAGATLYMPEHPQEVRLTVGMVVGVGVTMTLITHMLKQSQKSLRQQNERLRASEARFRSVLDAGADALFLVEPLYDDAGLLIDAIVVDLNQLAEAMVGFSREHAIGARVLDLSPAFAQHRIFRSVQQMPPEAREHGFEYCSSRGMIYTVRVHRVGNLLAVALRDITEARRIEQIQQEIQQLTIQLEKERELNSLRATLMATISHEFRTPLTIIMNNAEILDRYSHRLTDQQREKRVIGIKDQVIQLRSMLENISLIVQGTSEQLPFNPEEVDLGLYLRMLFDQVCEPAKETHTLHYEAVGNLKAVAVDLTLLHQVVSNLLTNSVKFTPQGGHVRLHVDGQIEDTITITVGDSGIGIPEKDLVYIFEPFHRGSNIGEVRGSGLGLSIVRECVLRHSGTLTVESAVGQGTTFTIRLPRHSLPSLAD